MAFKLSEILNPVPHEDAQQPSPPKLRPLQPPVTSPTLPAHTLRSPESFAARSSEPLHSSYTSNAGVVPATFEAAASLTALASAAGHYPTTYGYSHTQSPQMTSREHFPPIATYTYGDARRQSFAPTLPSPTMHSPTSSLEQYHQKPSQSPDEHRRQSFSSFEAPTLAPIKSASASLGSSSATPPAPGYGFDNAKIIQPPITSTSTSTNIATTEANYIAQNRESNYTRETPVASQIREPSVQAPEAKMTETSPEAEMRQPPVQSPPRIKDEPSGTPRAITPRERTPSQTLITAVGREKSVADEDLDPDTLAIIEAAKNEYGLRGSKARRSTDELPSPVDPAPVDTASKKRPAPKTTAANKKGTARKPPPKKRRTESEAGLPGAIPSSARDTTPSSRTSKTPGLGPNRNGFKSKSNTPALGSSPAPGGSSEIDEGAGSDDSSNEEYCICRKGDNHTWMIACDGGCEDWFHGKCVNIREEDGDLIDKYICPKCEANGKGVTTWLPMCRRDGCRQPARLKKGAASKYCSDECGKLFMNASVAKSAGATGSSTASSKSKKRKANQTDHIDGVDGAADSDEDMGPRGGALRPAEIKTLITSVPNIAAFRKLGEGVLSPPATATFPEDSKLTNGTSTNVNGINGDSGHSKGYTLNDKETSRIALIEEEKDVLRAKRQLLRDKERFVGMTREQVAKYAEREGIKPKDVCGYDKRLTWTDEQFDRWRKSKEGAEALELNTLGIPIANGEVDGKPEDTKKEEPEDDKMDIDGQVNIPAMTDSFCTRKRCERHRNWPKQALSDVRFEESNLADEMRQLDKEEREIREGAMLRWRKVMGGTGDKEGWVEVVGA